MTSLSQERLSRDAPEWRNTTIAIEAFKKAQLHPNKVAIFLEDEPDATYGSIAEEALKLIAALHALGLQQGDVISFQLPNWREGAVIDIAAAALGLVVNPIVPIYRDAELRFILSDAASKLIFIPDQHRSIDYVDMITRLRPELPNLETVVTVRAEAEYPGAIRYEQLTDCEPAAQADLPSVDPNSVKCRLYTSGTTGFPKAVLHSHNTLIRILDNTSDHSGTNSSDVMIMENSHHVGQTDGWAHGQTDRLIDRRTRRQAETSGWADGRP